MAMNVQVTYNALIDGCVRANDLQKAVTTLDAMDQAGIRPNHITYSTLINGYVCLTSRVSDSLHVCRLAS